MRAFLILASLVLAFAPGVVLAQAGECGAPAKKPDGKTVACKCDERPNCDQEGDCHCTPDEGCRVSACGAPEPALAHLDPVRPVDLPIGTR
jgi:hypothetical protein